MSQTCSRCNRIVHRACQSEAEWSECEQLKPHHREQIGDYAVELPTPRSLWTVRVAGAPVALSEHNTKAEAKAAVKRYQQRDKR